MKRSIIFKKVNPNISNHCAASGALILILISTPKSIKKRPKGYTNYLKIDLKK